MADDDTERSLSVPVADGVFAVAIDGSGDPTVLLHGLSANRSTWREVTARLSPSLCVVAPDLLGRGESSAAPHARFRLDDEVRRLESLLDRLGIAVPILVGHSQGAAVAMAFAARRPVRGLVLVNPVNPLTRRPAILELLRLGWVRRVAATPLSLFRRPLTRYILERRVFADPSRADAEAVERYSAPYASSTRARSLARVLADWTPGELESLSLRPDLPVRILAGGQDRRISAGAATAWARRLGAELTVLEACAHGVPEEAPEEVARQVLELHGMIREVCDPDGAEN